MINYELTGNMYIVFDMMTNLNIVESAGRNSQVS